MNAAGRPKKALIQVVLSLGAGGTERLVIDMSKRLVNEARIHVVCTDEPGDWASQLSELGIPVTCLQRTPGFQYRLVREIRAIVRAYEAPVVHCHHYTPFVYGCLAALPVAGARVIYTEHGRYHDGPPSAKRWLANQVLGRLPGAFYAVSDDLRGHLIAEGFPARKMLVSHNGIDVGTPPTPAQREQARSVLGVTDNDWVIGTVARLHPVKDLSTLMQAVAKLPAQISWKLALVGDGEDRDRLARQADGAGIAERVVFTGLREDARELLPGFDAYVNCSIIEGISVTILEAMAAGVPIIATAVGGTPEVVCNERTALLIPAREPNALAQALTRLALDPSLAEQLRDAARVRVAEVFSTEQMLGRYRAAYGW